jgi:hypothetical protein
MKKLLSLLAFIVFTITASAQDFTLDPHFGTVNLRAGFVPDPHVVTLRPGGSINLSQVRKTIGISARGFVSSAPDVDLNYVAGDHTLTFKVEGGNVDTVLLINDPQGRWYFNDDTNGRDPLISFQNPTSGQYNIWVGTYGSESSGRVRLLITEL